MCIASGLLRYVRPLYELMPSLSQRRKGRNKMVPMMMLGYLSIKDVEKFTERYMKEKYSQSMVELYRGYVDGIHLFSF